MQMFFQSTQFIKYNQNFPDLQIICSSKHQIMHLMLCAPFPTSPVSLLLNFWQLSCCLFYAFPSKLIDMVVSISLEKLKIEEQVDRLATQRREKNMRICFA